MASRILGLVRDQVLAYYFGAGDAMDAFRVAFRIPNLVRDLFAEGAMVRAGQILYEVEDAPYRAALGGAQGNLARAQASTSRCTTASRPTPLIPCCRPATRRSGPAWPARRSTVLLAP